MWKPYDPHCLKITFKIASEASNAYVGMYVFLKTFFIGNNNNEQTLLASLPKQWDIFGSFQTVWYDHQSMHAFDAIEKVLSYVPWPVIRHLDH